MSDVVDFVKPVPYEPFQLVEEGEEALWFSINTRSGSRYGHPYRHFIRVDFKVADTLTIRMTGKTFIIDGQNLKSVYRAFLDEELTSLEEFNPDKHKPIKDQDAIVIHRIRAV